MKKRILVISQYFHPENFRINDICKEWIKRNYEVTVVTGIPNYPQGKFFEGYGFFKKRKEMWNGIRIIRLPLIPRGNSSVGMILNYMSFVISGFVWNLFTQVKADRVFIFEVSPMTQALCGIQYAKRKKIPCDLYVQDLWPENIEIVTGIKSRLVLGPIEKMVHYIYKNCNRIFATSESFVKEIRKRLDNNLEKVVYWPQYAEETCIPKQTVGVIKRDVFRIMFTGNIGQAQGLETLPKVAEILKSQNCQVKFILIGDGRNKNKLQSLVKEKHIESYFEFSGQVPTSEVANRLEKADVAYLSFMDTPLFYKTIPAKLQTYLACGKPILAAAKGETKKIVEQARCGICCAIGDANELAEAIIKMRNMADEELSVMGMRALEYSREFFSKEKLMNQMDRYINEIKV